MSNISKSFKLLRLVFFLLIGVISYGCSSNQSGALKPEKSEISYKYNKNVVPQTKKRLSYIKEVRGNSIIYKADTPKRKLPKAGDIISSGICDQFPHGIGARVLDVHPLASGDYECITTPATLDEIFDELSISSYTNLANNKDSTVTAIDKSGNEVKIKIVSSPAIKKQRSLNNKNFLFANPLSVIDLTIGKNQSDLYYEIPFNFNHKENPLGLDIGVSSSENDSFSIGISGEYNLQGNIHAGLGLIYECDLKAKTYKFAIAANCGFEINELLVENDLSFSTDIFDYEIVNQYIDLGPVVLNATLHLVLSAQFSHSGYFKSHASKDVGVELGITHNGTYERVYNEGNKDRIIQIDSLNSSTCVSLPFYPKVAVGLYDEGILNGKLEPYINFGAEANCVYEDEDLFKTNPTIKLFSRGGLDASVNIFEDYKVAISKTGKIASFSIWEKGWPLLPVLDSKSVSIIPKKSGETYVMSYRFSSDGIIQKWNDCIWAGAQIVHEDSLIQRQPSKGIADLVSAREKYDFTFDNLSLVLDQSYMARPIVFFNNRVYECNGIAFTVNGLTFNTKDYYIKRVKYYDAYSDEDLGCDFWSRDHYHYYHDLIFEVDGAERAVEIGNQCTTDDYHKELSLSLHDGILKGQYVFLTTDKVSSFMVETVPYAYMLNGERLTFEPYQFRLWRDESIVGEWFK